MDEEKVADGGKPASLFSCGRERRLLLLPCLSICAFICNMCLTPAHFSFFQAQSLVRCDSSIPEEEKIL